jgi:hypothetical protein
MKEQRKVKDQLEHVQKAIGAILKDLWDGDFRDAGRLASVVHLVEIQRTLLQTVQPRPSGPEIEMPTSSGTPLEGDGDEDYSAVLHQLLHIKDGNEYVEWDLDDWACPVCESESDMSLVASVPIGVARPYGPSMIRAGFRCSCSECEWNGDVREAAFAYHRERLGLPQTPRIERLRHGRSE